MNNRILITILGGIAAQAGYEFWVKPWLQRQTGAVNRQSEPQQPPADQDQGGTFGLGLFE